MTRDQCVLLGHISKAHGLQGQLKAFFDVHDISFYKDMEVLYFGKKDQPLRPVMISNFHITSSREAILDIEDVNNRDTADAYKSYAIYFPSEFLPDLGKDHYYYFEIIGYSLIDSQNGFIGKITGIMDSGPNDLIIANHKDQEVLIPMHDHILQKVDKDSKTVTVNLPDGLLELFLGEE